MGAALGGVVRLLLGGLGTLIGGWKVFALGLFMAGMAIIIHNTLMGIIESMLNFTLQRVQGISAPDGSYSMSLSGAAAWLAIMLKLPDCLSITMSCLSIRVLLKSIPFVKVN